jgi:cell division protein FtsB
MNEALDTALERIQKARADIRSEIESIAGEVARLKEENRTLPMQTASFGELKKGNLDLVKSAGTHYTETSIRGLIIDFAKGATRDMASLSKYGQPLSLGELDAAVTRKAFPIANTKFISSNGDIGDLALYAVLQDAVQETLSRVLDQLSPADLGVKADSGGMTREEMNERIAANRAEIERLESRKTTLASELKKLS